MLGKGEEANNCCGGEGERGGGGGGGGLEEEVLEAAGWWRLYRGGHQGKEGEREGGKREARPARRS